MPLPSLPHLSLEPVHRRGWGSTYAALARGQIDTERHRDCGGLERAASKQQRHPGHGTKGPRPIVRGTVVRVQVERVPAKTRPPKVLWLWWASPGGA